MAKEMEVWEVIRNAGYEPISDKCIIVSYAPTNLSDKILRFFSNEFYIFQMCKNEMVLVPFGKWTLDLKKEVALEIPYESIKSIKVAENGLNYDITIQTESDQIALSAQQGELSDLRSAGILAGGINSSKNWHKENLDNTLKALRNIKN